MLDDDSYEQLAELYISLNENSSSDSLFCICSRSILRRGVIDDEKFAYESIDSSINDKENTIRFLNSSTESHPSTVHKKKDPDEGVSCYCSASHCSTDDSTRDALHSDSGADLSETSRDPDWEEYWAKNGESIIWQSWIERYGEYVDPSYQRENKQSSSGIAENISEVSRDNSDITRLSYSSEVSDSLTNVTPITLSELSTEESSLLSSSDSAGSVSADAAQWQALWIDHFNVQYQLAYENFKCVHIGQENQKDEIEKEKDNTIESIKNYISLNTCANRKFNKKRSLELSSVGHILNHLRSINVAQANENVEESCCSNDEVQCSTSESRRTENPFSLFKKRNSLSNINLSFEDIISTKQVTTNDNDNLLNSQTETESIMNHSSKISNEAETSKTSSYSSTDQENKTRIKLKRPHEREDDKLRSAFNLFGLSYNGEGISTGSVFYKKRNIRWQNRLLNLNTHIHFDDDGLTNTRDKKTEKIAENSEVFHVTSSCELKSDFSEKDDSSEEEFYSASEESDAKKEKRKKKKRRKGLPKEILDNEKLLKFWYQRYRLFSKFDYGIKLDEESWYSVTPEKVSRHTAERCRCDLIIDACCGAGGNTIQFAFICERVIAIDIDPYKIELARHNAKIYGVEDRIEFIVGDFIKLAPSLQADVVFLSPPWGGIGYSSEQSYSLNKILPPIGGTLLYEIAAQITPNVAMYLPRNINSDELLRLAGPGGSLELEQNFLGKKLIAVTAYFGELVGSFT